MDLVDSRFYHVWYMTDSVDSKGNFIGITSMSNISPMSATCADQEHILRGSSVPPLDLHSNHLSSKIVRRRYFSYSSSGFRKLNVPLFAFRA